MEVVDSPCALSSRPERRNTSRRLLPAVRDMLRLATSSGSTKVMPHEDQRPTMMNHSHVTIR
jgi:hypothetical protein